MGLIASLDSDNFMNSILLLFFITILGSEIFILFGIAFLLRIVWHQCNFACSSLKVQSVFSSIASELINHSLCSSAVETIFRVFFIKQQQSLITARLHLVCFVSDMILLSSKVFSNCNLLAFYLLPPSDTY